MRYFLLCLFIITALSACSTTGGLRQTDPTMVKTYDGNFKKMASCVAEKVDEKFQMTVSLRINEENKYAHVFMVNLDSGNTRWDFLFKQDGQKNKVIVESRGMITVSGRGGYPKLIWPLVDQCAAE